jgi:KDO2-lipid IV(A) lauroyltransferase
MADSLPWLTVKDLLWFVYLYPFRIAAATLPRGLLYALARLADPLVQYRSRRGRAAAIARMIQAGISPADAQQAGRRFVSNAATRVLDDLMLRREGVSRIRATVEGLEYLDEGIARGRGVLLLSAHTYASRPAKRYLAAQGYPILTVRNRQPPVALMGRVGARWLQPRYMEFLHGVIQDEVYIQDPECSLKILKRLRAGGIVNIHLDLDARAVSKAEEFPFLNVPRRVASGPFDVARLTRCALIPMFSRGRGKALFIRFGAPAPAGGLAREDFARAALPYFVEFLEERIREHPDEWELWTRL